MKQLLKKLGKKGFYEILLFVEEKGQARYSEVLDYVVTNKIVASDATVTAALNYFTELGLLKRRTSQERPVRTNYSLSKKGKLLAKYLFELERL